MVETEIPVLAFTSLPDHTLLPDSDGTFAPSFREHPQSIILTDSILPILQARHPDGQFCIGQDCGIYWNLRESLSDRPTRGAISPDWFYVPRVPPLPNNQVRRSYVMRQEVTRAQVEVYHLVDGHYGLASTNQRGHYVITSVGVELGIWQGSYGNIELPWMRRWDAEGNLLLTGDQRAKQEHQRADLADVRAEQERQRANRLAERLRALGIDSDAL